MGDTKVRVMKLPDKPSAQPSASPAPVKIRKKSSSSTSSMLQSIQEQTQSMLQQMQQQTQSMLQAMQQQTQATLQSNAQLLEVIKTQQTQSSFNWQPVVEGAFKSVAQALGGQTSFPSSTISTPYL